MWHTGSGNTILLEDIFKSIGKQVRRQGRVFIGCDSQIIKQECIFSTVICFHGAVGQQGGNYFFVRERFLRKEFPSILLRLTKEVEKSINIASEIVDNYPEVDIEIHIDSSSKENEATSKYTDMLVGYARGAGFSCKVKPFAWASNSIADKHSK